ncbi:sulfite exporter TauE/SafE family protein [Rothia sp. p3-SID1597]|nr:sulfite exporter TauE/SafE family protein [Rothia sp. p3-SID1597]
MLWWILPAVVVGTILQRISGTGVGLVVAPVFTLILGGASGIFLANLTTAVSGALLTVALWRFVNWKQWRLLCLSAVLGTVPGAVLVRLAPGPVLQLIVGSVVALALVVTLAGKQTRAVQGSGVGVVSGAAGGLLNVTAGVAAPAMVIYSRVTSWRQTEYAATMQPVFMTLGLMSLVAKWSVGAVHGAALPAPWLLPGVALSVVVGLVMGRPLVRRISPKIARTLALTLAGAGAALTIGKGILGLMMT